jgi:hypothetical protein
LPRAGLSEQDVERARDIFDRVGLRPPPIERFGWHYTPKHGSWLDLAESELGVLTSQCLDRSIPDEQTLIDEIAAWQHGRDANLTKANWQFTTKNARIKLKHLYPSISESGD